MTLEELYFKLKKLGISDNKFYLQGLYGSENDDDKFSLIRKNNNNTEIYEFYYKEKGGKHSIRMFYDRNEAFQYFYNCLKDNKNTEDNIGNASPTPPRFKRGGEEDFSIKNILEIKLDYSN